MRALVLLCLLLLGFASPTSAAVTPDKSKALIEGMAQDAISTLALPNKTPAQIAEKFDKILRTNFDFEGIARFVLGRYWRVATPEQQAEYIKLFGAYVVGVYANRFQAYSGETISVDTVRLDGSDALVTSKINLTGGRPPVTVDWKISEGPDGSPKVADVIIEQVSMSITQRSEFASIIAGGGGKVETLLAQLRARTNGLNTANSNNKKPG
jgi:phospholipid transport system substrate-binding protein